MTPLVLKLGGELLEQPSRLGAIAAVIAATPSPLVIVHGGGREIDAALARAGIAKRQVDGLRVTDADTLGIVVEVLAGAVNTRFVAAIKTLEEKKVGYPHGEDLDVLDSAKYVRDEVVPAMDAAREVADKLERIVSDDLWPLPKYSELLFIK